MRISTLRMRRTMDLPVCEIWGVNQIQGLRHPGSSDVERVLPVDPEPF